MSIATIHRPARRTCRGVGDHPGVYERSGGRFAAQTSVGGVQVYLGTFDTAAAATEAIAAARSEARMGLPITRHLETRRAFPKTFTPGMLREKVGRYAVLPVASRSVKPPKARVEPVPKGWLPHVIALPARKALLLQSRGARAWALAPSVAGIVGGYAVGRSPLAPFGQIEARDAAQLRQIATLAAYSGFRVAVGEAN